MLRFEPSDGVGPVLEVDGDQALLGRQSGVDLVVDDPSVSRKHALIERRGNQWVVTDQGSANGTFLEGVRIQTSVVQNGQEISFGSRTFRVQIAEPEVPDLPTVAMPQVPTPRSSPPRYSRPVQPPTAAPASRLVGGGLWREGRTLVLARSAALPNRCVRCGEAASDSLRRKFYYHHPALYLLILAGVIVYVVVALIVRKDAELMVPICERHRSSRRLLMSMGVGLVVLSLVIGVWSGIRQFPLGFVVAAFTFLFGLVASVIGQKLVIPTKIDDSFIWLNGVHVSLLTDLPAWPGPMQALLEVAGETAVRGVQRGLPPLEPTSGMATAAAVVGGLSIFLLCPGPVAVALGAAGIWDVQRTSRKGMGRAIFGLIAGLGASAALLAAFLTGFYRSFTEAQHRPSAGVASGPAARKTVFITSKDKALRIVAPADWRWENMVATAPLQACDAPQQACIEVFADLKSALPGMTLERYSRVSRGLLLKKLGSGDEQGPKPLSNIGAYSALQYELRGRVGAQDFVYLHTAVEAPTRYYSILAWTSNRLFAQEQPTLQGIVGSFEEVAPK